MVNYNPGEDKDRIRELVLSFFLENNCTSVLTLPNLFFSLEEQLVNNKIKVDCIERDFDVFNKQKELKVNSEINLMYGTIGDLDYSNYDGVFLDLCGCFTKEVDKVLKNIQPNTSIVITLLARRENNSLKKDLNINNRTQSYIDIFRRYGVRVSKYVTYKDNSPMMVFFAKKN